MNVSTCRDQCWQQQGGAGCSSSSSSSSLTTAKLMMDARGCLGCSIGDVVTSASHGQGAIGMTMTLLNKVAHAEWKPSAPMTANGAAEPIVLVAVSNGSKSH